MPASILSSNYFLPGVFSQTNFAQSVSTSGQGAKKVVFIGHFSGTATANTIYGADTSPPLSTAADAETLFGLNTELTQAIKTFLASNTTNPIYAIPVTDSGTAGTSTIALAAGTATKANILNIKINNKFVQVAIKSGDASTAIVVTAAALIKSLRAEFIGSSATSTITVTAGAPGARNQPVVSAWLTFADSVITPTTTNSAVTGTSTVTIATALGLLDDTNNFYYKVCIPGADETATTNTVELLSTHVTAQAQPLAKNRSIGFTSCRLTKANAITYALQTKVNNPRVVSIIKPLTTSTAAEVVAKTVASISLVQSASIPKFNMNFFGLTQESDAVWNAGYPLGLNTTSTSLADIEALLENGWTPISDKQGKTYIVRPITSKSYDTVNSINDYRILDAHKVFVIDRVAELLEQTTMNFISSKTIMNDPVDQNASLPPNVITPKYIKNAIFGAIDQLYADGWIENVSLTKAQCSVARDTVNAQRVNIQLGIDSIDVLAQCSIIIDQVG